MERLTEWTGDQWIPVQKRIAGKYPGYRVCMERLAEYENTGLTPAEIERLIQAMELVCAIIKKV